MIATLLAAQSPLIRPSQFSPSAPAAPAPPPSPQPGGTGSFSAEKRDPVYFEVGTAVSNLVLATTATDVASVTLYITGNVPAGLTVTHDNTTPSAGELRISGTPTGPIGAYFFHVAFMQDGYLIFGGVRIKSYVNDDTKVLTIGAWANPDLIEGREVTVTLCTLSANFEHDLRPYSYAIEGPDPPGMTSSIEYTPGPTSSGSLVLTGTPTERGSYFVKWSYRDLRTLQLGISAHNITVKAPYIAPGPAPAPSPAPSPTVPATPPPPGLEPEPGGPDPYAAQVLALYRFNTAITDDTQLVYEHVNELGVSSLFGGMGLTEGAHVTALNLTSGGYVNAQTAATWDVASSSFTVDVTIKPAAGMRLWTPGGSQNHYAPIVSMVLPGGDWVWTLGLYSRLYAPRSGIIVTTPIMVVASAGSHVAAGAGQSTVTGNQFQWTRLAGMVSVSGSTATVASWFQGLGGAPVATTAASLPAWREGAYLQVGGQLAVLPQLHGQGISLVGQLPMIGAVDELRITKAARYTVTSGITDLIGTRALALPYPSP